METTSKFQLLSRLKQMILLQGLSDSQMALNISIGLGTIFIPFPAIQTPFVFGICFLLRLNFPLVYSINWINNHFTVLPICFAGLITGHFLLILLPVDYDTVATFSLNFSEFTLDIIPALLKPFVTGSVFLMIMIPLISYIPIFIGIKSYRKKE